VSTAERDLDRWERRLASLGAIVGADALAVVLPVGTGRHVVYAAHNLAGRTWLDGPIEQLVALALERREPQRRGSLDVALADGRQARAGLIAPSLSSGRLVGAVVALRLAEPFAQRDLAAAEALADLVGLELSVSNQLQRAERREIDLADALAAAQSDRRHALALYELARIATAGGGRMARLQRATDVLADVLGCATVALFEQAGNAYALIAAHGYPDGAPRTLRSDRDELLGAVAKQRLPEIAKLTPGGGGWARGAEALAIPIVAGGRVTAVLALVRSTESFAPADLELAPLVADRIRALDSPSETARHTEVVSTGAIATNAWTGATAAPAPVAPAVAPTRAQRPWLVVLLALVLALALAGTAALGLGGVPLYALAAVVALCAAWAATGSGVGLQFLLLATLISFVERASSPLLVATQGTEQLAAAGAAALIALVAAGLAASALRRTRA